MNPAEPAGLSAGVAEIVVDTIPNDLGCCELAGLRKFYFWLALWHPTHVPENGCGAGGHVREGFWSSQLRGGSPELLWAYLKRNPLRRPSSAKDEGAGAWFHERKYDLIHISSVRSCFSGSPIIIGRSSCW